MLDLSEAVSGRMLVIVVGPTGVGKSALALRLALAHGAEIVSADSRQVYRYMDIGTGKPTQQERALVPHHLIDVVDPDEPYSLADFQAAAYAHIDDIRRRGRLPLLVGGTGLYIKAVAEGLTIPAVPPDPALRAALAREAGLRGPEWLVEEVRRVDPALAAREAANPRRLLRGLEVYRSTGQPLSALQGTNPPDYPCLWLGLTMQRDELYRRIDARVDGMVQAGLVDEVAGLAARGYGWHLPAMSGLGYRQVGAYLRGECDLQTAIQRVKHATHAFVRHQYSWFRLADPRIRWLDASGFSTSDTL